MRSIHPQNFITIASIVLEICSGQRTGRRPPKCHGDPIIRPVFDKCIIINRDSRMDASLYMQCSYSNHWLVSNSIIDESMIIILKRGVNTVTKAFFKLANWKIFFHLKRSKQMKKVLELLRYFLVSPGTSGWSCDFCFHSWAWCASLSSLVISAIFFCFWI